VIPQDLLLVKILKIMVDVLPVISLPPRVGRPYVYQPVVLVCCILVMLAKHLSVRGLYQFLTCNEAQAVAVRAVIPFPDGKIPSRRTFDRRLIQAVLSLQLYMVAATTLMVNKFHIGIARLSLDNRMFEAVGAIWHRKHQKAGIIPDKLRNVDTTAGWGKSHYRGWVFGHGLDVFVTTGKLVVPVLAVSRSLTIRGNTAAKQITHLLPQVIRGVVSADSEYEDSVLTHKIRDTGRSLHVSSKNHPDQIPTSRTYQRRKVTVEPFFERFLLAFIARGKLDRKGPQAWPHLVGCCLLYQLMVIHNLAEGATNPIAVTHLIRIL
jgi:hypothetical protein